MTIYRWKPGKERVGGDVQRIGEVLDTLVTTHGDSLTPKVVVDAARPDSSPMHGLFEWNDLTAAEKYREQQALVVMRSIEIIPEKTSAPRQMFVAVVEERDGKSQKNYITTAKLSSEMVLTLQVLEAAMDNIEGFRERYGKFQELSLVADRAQGEIYNLMKKHQALSRLKATSKPKPVTVSRVDQSVPRSTGSQMQELLDEFDICYREKLGVSAPIVRGKDHKLAQDLLRQYDIVKLKQWTRRFFQIRDPFIQKSGYTFGVFKSCIGKVIADDSQPKNDRFNGLRDFVNNG